MEKKLKTNQKRINNLNQKKQKANLICAVGNTFLNWIVILFKMRFRINIRFLFRSIVITFISLILSPFVILEIILFNKKIKKIKIKSPVFIIGHMRSGTTFLHYLLSQDKRFGYITTSDTIFPSISLTLGKLINKFMDFVLPSKRPMDNMDIGYQLPQEDEFAVANLCPYSPNIGAYFPRHLVEYYEKYSLFNGISDKVISKWKKVYDFVLKKIIFKTGKQWILSKSLVNAGRIKILSEMYPDAKFICIYRNPYSVFLSTKKLYKKFIFPNMSLQCINDNKLEENIITLAKIGFKKYFEDRMKIKKSNIIEIQYESFVKNPINYLKKIYEKLNITDFKNVKSLFENFLKLYKDYKADSYQIEESLKNKIYKELKFVFEELGYNK